MYPKNDISWDLDKYIGAFNFRITVDGIAQESMKVVGVSNVISESEIVEYKIGTDQYVRKIPGRSKFSEVEITRIYQGYDQLYGWRAEIEDGKEDLRTVKIEVLAPDLTTVILQMILHNCWPLRWQLPNLDASSTAPATETIALACEQITQSVASPKNVTSTIEILSANPAQIPEAVDFAPPTAGDEKQDFRDNDLTKYQGKGEQDFRENDLTKYQGEGEKDFRDNDLTKYQGDGLLRFSNVDDALKLAGQLGKGPLLPNEETWDPPEKTEDPTAEKNGGDGGGPLAKSSAHGEKLALGEAGKIGEDFEATESGTAERTGPDDSGTGPKYVGEKEFGGSAAYEDPTAAKNGGDGSGPIGGQGAKEEADYGKGEGPLGGQGEKEEADYGEGDGINYLGEKEFGGSSAFEDPTAGRNGGDGSGPIDPSQKGFGDSAAADDPTAAKNGGDGGGPLGGQGEKEEADYGSGSGPLGGQGAKEEADYGSGSGPIDPSQKGFGDSAAADDPTAAKNGGDGGGPIGGQGAKEEADYGSGSGPIDPSQKGFGDSAAADDPTAGKNGGDGGGPIGGQGAPEAADSGSGSGPIDPSQKGFGDSAAADDPTAGKNGGDGGGPVGGQGEAAGADSGGGSGPIGGQGAAATADGGAGSGPIDNERQDFGGSAAADDPTAAKNGGGGSGPIGGRGHQAEADYGSPGSGPIGGQGAPEGAG